MNFYFSTNNIKELDNYSFQEKHLIITLANKRLTPPQKLILGILKLVLLIPPFWFLAQLDSWWMLLPVAFLMVSYMVILRPLSLSFSVTHLEAALKEFASLTEEDDD